ncbi:prolyl oligopeptidase family serine peptidase [Thalassotalea aquiviva]|uniref:prolyl oligopeptidase family serine peptidase n=1 Tax=Thalassotalea aquiviva TaxID=3242415 RepID=UPI00352AC973
MLNKLLLGISTLVLFACSEQPITPTPAKQENQTIAKPAPIKTYSTEEFFNTVSVFGSSINFNKSAILVSSDESGVFNAYRYPIDGATPSQLTYSKDDAIFVQSWFPNDDRFLYTKDQGGNELNHLYVQNLLGHVIDLTPGKNLKANFIGWLNDNSFVVTTNERDPKAMDVYVYSSSDYSREMVYQNNDMLMIADISKDGRYLALIEATSGADSNIYLVDLKNDKKTTLITEHQGYINHSVYTFTPDSTALIYSTNEYSEFNQAWKYDLKKGEKNLFYAAEWDVSFVYFSDDGQYTIKGVNADGQTKLTISASDGSGDLKLPPLPAGDMRGVNFSKDTKKMVFYINSDTSPSNLFSYQLGQNKVKQLTYSLPESMSSKDLVASEVVRFNSFDNLSIPGLLYKPHQASSDKPVPALIWVHGGPGGQSRKGYRAAIQHLVNQGYAVFAVNNRGSSGYGKTFYHLDDKNHGENDLQDIVYGKKYLQTLDWVQDDKIGIMGGSYGGYMTMAGMAFTDEFNLGINIFGVTNWVRTLKSIPPWWEAFKQALYDEMGDPATDEARHRRISPLFHANNIKKPVLVVQGANDPRVLQVESDEMVAAIRANNVPVEYVLFSDEGHGFRKKSNRIIASKAYINFLNKYM